MSCSLVLTLDCCAATNGVDSSNYVVIGKGLLYNHERTILHSFFHDLAMRIVSYNNYGTSLSISLMCLKSSLPSRSGINKSRNIKSKCLLLRSSRASRLLKVVVTWYPVLFKLSLNRSPTYGSSSTTRMCTSLPLDLLNSHLSICCLSNRIRLPILIDGISPLLALRLTVTGFTFRYSATCSAASDVGSYSKASVPASSKFSIAQHQPRGVVRRKRSTKSGFSSK